MSLKYKINLILQNSNFKCRSHDKGVVMHQSHAGSSLISTSALDVFRKCINLFSKYSSFLPGGRFIEAAVGPSDPRREVELDPKQDW